MKVVLTLCNTEHECGKLDEAFVEMVVETGLSSGLFCPDVYLTLGDASYEVSPAELVVLGRAMEAYLAQRRAADAADKRYVPTITYS
ncbi:MAG TPA: hypothetical protein VM537_10765 [Anaerolineae bacterium]|nr:hypothetical protein [Anaerolineae bacterium]